MKNLKIFLVVLLASTFLFFLKNETYAFTCLSSLSPQHIAICENNVCKEGFEIYYESTGLGCDEIPIVKENVLNLGEIFQLIFYQKNIQNAKGIYEISSESSCSSDDYLENKDNWNKYCADGATVTKLSESTSLEDLYSYKSYWKSKEAEERKLVQKDKQKIILFFIIPPVLLILITGLPILAILRSPNKRYLTAFLILAPIVQFGFLFLQSIVTSFPGTLSEEEYLVIDIIAWIISLAIIFEVFFLIFRIGKRLFHRAR